MNRREDGKIVFFYDFQYFLNNVQIKDFSYLMIFLKTVIFRGFLRECNIYHSSKCQITPFFCLESIRGDQNKSIDLMSGESIHQTAAPLIKKILPSSLGNF